MQFVGDQSYNDQLTSSVGVRFFSMPAPPQSGALVVEELLGLVEELKVVLDPEYQHWRDLIRSDRSSNEERLGVFHVAAMQARRKLGKKALEMNANAVLGYREYVDLEGDATDRICVRAFGTAARVAAPRQGGEGSDQAGLSTPRDALAAARPLEGGHGPELLPPAAQQRAGLAQGPRALSRSLSGEVAAAGAAAALPPPDRGSPTARMAMAEPVQLLAPFRLHTLNRLPIDVRPALCGVVAARAVKVFSSRTTQDQRESWWSELREELLSHARALGGDTIVGYQEHISIVDDAGARRRPGPPGTARPWQCCP
ncbi:unnamed protein product [Prorocentrum cordatum]|uniref:C2 domain-containing protein n=1 Tax=Prorocentrum cordatum TaxID=2364126 RepID=A0ABN9TAN1_9DINO|nr:unnamed protein product [Polarella glacialis]